MKKPLILSTFLFSVHALGQAGGWVGNSPATVASNGNYFPDATSYFQGPEEKKIKNYFLNPAGEHRFNLGLGYNLAQNRDSLYLGLAYSYGISDNVTFAAPMIFDIGLLSNNGHGHELALEVGIPGFSYTQKHGCALFPTVGLKYTYGTETIRLIAAVYSSYAVNVGRGKLATYSTDGINQGLFINSSFKGVYQAKTWLSLEAGLDSFYKAKDDFTNTLYAGPNFIVNKWLTTFMRARTTRFADNEQKYGGVIGVSLSF